MTRALTPVDTATQALSSEAQQLVRASKAENTKRAYRFALEGYQAFLAQRGVTTLPSEPALLVEYLGELARSHRPSSIQVKLAGISFAYRLQGGADPTQSELVRAVMAGIRRTLGTAATKKAGVTRARLRAMLAVFGSDLVGLRNRALLLVGFAGAFRRSELVGLDVRDVRLEESAAVIRMRRSKTDQESQGATKHIPTVKDSKLCAVEALIRWMNAADLTSGPLFRPIDQYGHVRKTRLGDRAVALIVKQAARAAGLDDFQFSGHSLRIGFVTQAADDEVPEWQIQEVTGHKSTNVLRGYIRNAGKGQRKAVSRALGEQE